MGWEWRMGDGGKGEQQDASGVEMVERARRGGADSRCVVVWAEGSGHGGSTGTESTGSMERFQR